MRTTTLPAQAYFVNRVSCCQNRVIQFNLNFQLLAVNGSLYSSQFAKSNGTVLTFPVNGPQPAASPDPTSAAQLDPTNRLTMTRYVRINASAANCLHFRE